MIQLIGLMVAVIGMNIALYIISRALSEKDPSVLAVISWCFTGLASMGAIVALLYLSMELLTSSSNQYGM